jgi:hypothetical protein
MLGEPVGAPKGGSIGQYACSRCGQVILQRRQAVAPMLPELREAVRLGSLRGLTVIKRSTEARPLGHSCE